MVLPYTRTKYARLQVCLETTMEHGMEWDPALRSQKGSWPHLLEELLGHQGCLKDPRGVLAMVYLAR